MSINQEGPEGSNVLGDFHENEIEAFFSDFLNWNLIYKNFDVEFLSVDTEKEENRGFDFLYQLSEPFLSDSNYHGVIVESKGMKNTKHFNKSRLTKDISTLKHKMEKANSTKSIIDDQKIIDCKINYFKYGILCYRFRDFDLEKYKKVLRESQIKETRRGDNFPVIFILTNDRLSAFSHLRKKYNDIKYYYPYYKSHEAISRKKELSLFYLFSDLIPFESKEGKNILCFDKPSPASFKLIEQFCGKFNHDISHITLARANYTDIEIYKRYKNEWEKRAKKTLELSCLDFNMDCSENLAEVFKHD